MAMNTPTFELKAVTPQIPVIDLKEMLVAGLHFGHKTSRWHPKMRPFIWGAKNKVHLIDVSKTAILLERAGKFIKETSANGGIFLWVGTKKPAQIIVQKVASELGMPYVINRWVGGTLSNFDQIKKAITRLLHLRDVVNKSSSHYTKKEVVVLQKEIERLEKNVGGIIDLTYPPSGVIIVDAGKEHSAVKEAGRLGLPLIGMLDTNTDPSGINLVIPSNDDSPKAIAYVMHYLGCCAAAGKQMYTDKKAEERAVAQAAQKASRDKAEADRKAAIALRAEIKPVVEVKKVEVKVVEHAAKAEHPVTVEHKDAAVEHKADVKAVHAKVVKVEQVKKPANVEHVAPKAEPKSEAKKVETTEAKKAEPQAVVAKEEAKEVSKK